MQQLLAHSGDRLGQPLARVPCDLGKLAPDGAPKRLLDGTPRRPRVDQAGGRDRGDGEQEQPGVEGALPDPASVTVCPDAHRRRPPQRRPRDTTQPKRANANTPRRMFTLHAGSCSRAQLRHPAEEVPNRAWHSAILQPIAESPRIPCNALRTERHRHRSQWRESHGILSHRSPRLDRVVRAHGESTAPGKPAFVALTGAPPGARACGRSGERRRESCARVPSCPESSPHGIRFAV